MHSITYKYQVHAFWSQDDVVNGSSWDAGFDTLKEAKKNARYCLTEEFRLSGEMSERFGYAEVQNYAGECVFDCFSK